MISEEEMIKIVKESGWSEIETRFYLEMFESMPEDRIRKIVYESIVYRYLIAPTKCTNLTGEPLDPRLTFAAMFHPKYSEMMKTAREHAEKVSGYKSDPNSQS